MTDTKAAAAIFGVGPRNGVGAELCHQAARAGHHVFVNGRTAEKIEFVANAINAEGGSAALPASPPASPPPCPPL